MNTNSAAYKRTHEHTHRYHLLKSEKLQGSLTLLRPNDGAWRNAGVAPCITNLAGRERRMVSFAIRPLYPEQYLSRPLGRLLSGPQTRSGRCGKQKTLSLYLSGNELRVPTVHPITAFTKTKRRTLRNNTEVSLVLHFVCYMQH